jgi:hypothetical protein
LIEHKYEFFGHQALSLFSVSRNLALVTAVIEPIPSGADNATNGVCPDLTHPLKHKTFADATKPLLAQNRGASARSSHILYSTAHRALIGNDSNLFSHAGKDFQVSAASCWPRVCLVKKDHF